MFILVKKPTDRDSYEFKRISVSGRLINNLFDEYYKLQQDDIYLKIDEEYLYLKIKMLIKIWILLIYL